jgi:uncharacterized protein YegP (UPF0339 family)
MITIKVPRYRARSYKVIPQYSFMIKKVSSGWYMCRLISSNHESKGFGYDRITAIKEAINDYILAKSLN